MSTRSTTSAQQAQSAKVRGFVNRQLDRTRRQVKTTELISHFLVATLFVVGFLQLLALVDSWVWPLNAAARWACCVLLVGGTLAYLGWAIGPLLRRKIHPDYAAKMIEDGQPKFKNSLLNYVSLRHRPQSTHAAVMDAVTKQAAIDLQTVPEDSAVDRSSIIRIGFYLLGLVAFVAVYWMLSPKDPLKSFARILMPSAKTSAPSIVQVTDVSPGDNAIFFGDPVVVSATVKGHFDPQDVQLIYSTDDGQVVDSKITMQQQSPSSSRFEATLATGQGGVQQGLVYRVEARDGASPDYEILVRPNPSITIDSVEITPPDYTLLPSETIQGQGIIEAVEGSLIRVNAIANLPIKLAYIELLVKKPKQQSEFVVVETVSMTSHETTASGEFHAIYNYQSRKQRATHFRLKFLSINDDTNDNANVHAIGVIPDLSPEIEVLNPIQNSIRLPINETLLIDVRAVDLDYGISSIELEMQNNGSNLFRRQKLPLRSEAGKKRVRGRFNFSPPKYFVKVGETVVFNVIASDNRTSYLSRSLDPNQTMAGRYQIEITEPVENPKRSEKPEQGKPEGEPNQGDSSDDGAQDDRGDNESQGDQGSEGPQPSQTDDSEREENDASEGSSDQGETQDPGQSQEGSEGESGEDGEASQSGGDGESQGQDQSSGSSESGEPQEGSGAEKGDESSGQNQGNNGQSDTGSQRGGDGQSQTGASDGRQQSSDSDAVDGERKPLDEDAADGDVVSRMQEIIEEERAKSGDAGQANPDGQDQSPASQSTGRGTDPEQNNPRQSEGTGSTQPDDFQSDQDAQGADNNAQRGQGENSSSQGEKNGTAKGASGNQTGDQSNEGASSEDSTTGQSDEAGGNDPGEASAQSSGQSEQGTGQSNSGQSGNPGTSPQEGAVASEQAGEGSGQQKTGGDPSEDGAQEGGSQSTEPTSDADRPGGQPSSESEGTSPGRSQGESESGSESGSEDQARGDTPPQSSSQEESDDEPPTPQSGSESSSENGAGDGASGQGEGGQADGGQAGDGQSGGESESQQSPSSSDQQPSGSSGAGEGAGAAQKTIAEKENLEHSKQATDMVLNRLEEERYEPDPELLKELNWSKEDLNQFLDRWKKMKAAAGSGDAVARERYDKALKSLGLSSDSEQRKVRGVSDRVNGFNTDSAVNRPPQSIAPGYRAFKRARNRSKN